MEQNSNFPTWKDALRISKELQREFKLPIFAMTFRGACSCCASPADFNKEAYLTKDCLRLICESHSLRFSPTLAGVVGIVPTLLREGVCFVVGCVWCASLACCWLGAPAACVFSSVSLEVLTFAFASSCLKFDEN